MTIITRCGNIGTNMIGICRLIVITLVATYTGFGCIVIDSSGVTIVAIGRSMCSGQWVIIAMDRESCRCPSRVRRVTIITSCGNICSYMIGICGGIENWQMAGSTLPGNL